ncbi:MAG: deoxyribose-phosphate aldolase [Phycisphaerales bacterium]|nr:MAG: deoxyribose-phosphate aldolase [Phycisphaerales bacterium]
MPPTELARRIDHTLLKPEATPEQIDALCDQAWQYGFASVCVNPVYVRRAVHRLDAGRSQNADAAGPNVVSVAGFPLGASTTRTKADEARGALDDGATEIDMVVALGALVVGDVTMVRRDIEEVSRVVHEAVSGGILKVILETAAITTEQIVLGCRCCVEGEADFVKSSTGFHPAGGATVEHVRLLHRCASPIPVKASGGIRTAAGANAMLEAGAARLGTSSGVTIMEELLRSTS